jgi:two-component system chemotaxis sensor kinase CheA
MDGASDGMIKVRTETLDKLIDLVGELTIAQSMVIQHPALTAAGDYDLRQKAVRAGKLMRDLQGLGMTLRMVPLKALFQRMARAARDLAHKSGKQVRFSVEGEDTEIDRSMVDALSTPLVHLIRNALDHGLESPSERLAHGKPEAGSLDLKAYQAESEVVIEVNDDGRGLDSARIAAKAVEKGLLASADGLSEAQAVDLIFAPGFSTASAITDVSGRGVGMDAVRQAVHALEGRIEVRSRPGQGCSFALRLPLTLAVTDGILVRVGAQRFVMPMADIHITLKATAGMLSTVAEQGEMLSFKGSLITVLRLHRLFSVPGATEALEDGLLMVIGDGRSRCALLVDELLGQQQVVSKGLGDALGRVQGVAGGAILGDGRVGLILDPRAIQGLLSLEQKNAAVAA